MTDNALSDPCAIKARIRQNTKLLRVLTPILVLVTAAVSILFGFHFSHLVIILVFVVYILGDSHAQKKRLALIQERSKHADSA